MTTTQPAEAVLFDLDGTLVDSAPDLAGALNALLEENGLAPQPLPAVKRMIGDGARKLVERGFQAGGVDAPEGALDRFLAIYAERMTQETTIYPGVVETLERLAGEGFHLSVCTNKPQQLSERLLAELDLARHFALVVGGDRFAEKKPHPLPVSESLRLLGARAAVMVGDSANDVISAQAAGLPAVLVTYGYRREAAEDIGADALADDFAELPAKINRLMVRATP